MSIASLEMKADAKAEKIWKHVVRSRRAEIRSGKAPLRSADEVMRDAIAAISPTSAVNRAIGGIA